MMLRPYAPMLVGPPVDADREVVAHLRPAVGARIGGRELPTAAVVSITIKAVHARHRRPGASDPIFHLQVTAIGVDALAQYRRAGESQYVVVADDDVLGGHGETLGVVASGEHIQIDIEATVHVD